jgi:hypothetical protein
MREPGGLTELGDAGAAAWAEHVRRLFSTGAAEVARELQTENGSVLASPTLETATVTAPDWTGLPVRVTACLGRDRGLRLLDRRSDRVDGGGRRWQEDYVEWRVLRHRGRIERVELTTELADYWRVLAAYDPARLLETVAELAGERAARPGLVFGAVDPFGDGVTPERRGEAFAGAMLPPHGRSPYNNGTRAICCMTQSTNSLRGLIMLVLAAASCRVVRDSLAGQLRCLTCLEAIPLIGNATLGRSSDPVLVERLGQLAYEGRLVAFDDPVGVYMQGVEHTRLRTPADEEVPSEWFAFSRGAAAGDSPDGRARYQRVTLEVPPGEGFVVGDLVDVATERPIRYGGEIADLLRLVTFFRVSAADAVVVDRKSPLELGADTRDDGCNGIRAYERRLARGAV